MNNYTINTTRCDSLPNILPFEFADRGIRITVYVLRRPKQDTGED